MSLAAHNSSDFKAKQLRIQLGSCFIFFRVDLYYQWQKAMNHEDKIMLTRVLSKENKDGSTISSIIYVSAK